MSDTTKAIPFTQLRVQVVELVDRLGGIVTAGSGVPSDMMSDLASRTRAPLFTVAATGPSRVGKSTLLNALFKQSVCPMGDFPKTAFPTRFEPGLSNRVVVTFDGKEDFVSDDVPATLGRYVTWDSNPENKSKVRGVVATISSPALNLGFSVLDLPGLDDPSDIVAASTELALEDADAILYVMNGAAVASNSFMFTRGDRVQLTRLAARAEKVFLVVNKSETLSEGQRASVARYLREQFARFDLQSLHDTPIIFISALAAFKRRCENDPASDDTAFSIMEDALFQYLVGHAEVGTNRLRGIISGAVQVAEEQLAIHSLSLARIEQAESIRRYLTEFEKLLGEIDSRSQMGLYDSGARVREAIFDYRSRASNRFSQTLQEIPLAQPLPTRDEMRVWLTSEFARMGSFAKGQAQSSFQTWSQQLNGRVNSVMAEFTSAVSSLPGGFGQLAFAGSLGSPEELNLWSPFWGTLGLGLVGLIFGPVGALVGAVAGFLIGLFVGEANRRVRESRKLREAVDSVLQTAAGNLVGQTESSLRSAFDDLRSALTLRVREAKTALEGKLAGIGTLPTPERQAAIRKAVADLQKARADARVILSSLGRMSIGGTAPG